MGRGRGKVKKSTANNHEDTGSGEEEKIPAQKRRGRPQKPLKDDMDKEDELEKIVNEDEESKKVGFTSKEAKSPIIAAENGKKRKQISQTKEKSDSTKEENGVSKILSSDELRKSNGFRHNGSRRKSTPRRAAEAIVECN